MGGKTNEKPESSAQTKLLHYASCGKTAHTTQRAFNKGSRNREYGGFTTPQNAQEHAKNNQNPRAWTLTLLAANTTIIALTLIRAKTQGL